MASRCKDFSMRMLYLCLRDCDRPTGLALPHVQVQNTRATRAHITWHSIAYGICYVTLVTNIHMIS